MKRHMFALLVIAVVSTSASAAYTFTQLELLGLTKVGGAGIDLGVTSAPNYGDTQSMSGIVGYMCWLPASLGTIEYGKSGISWGSETQFALTLINDDDDETHAWLFIGSSTSGSHVSLPKKTPVTLSMLIPGGADSTSVFGFGLENNKAEGSDVFHVSANPVPAPAALLLGGLGTLLVGGLRRRIA